MTTEQPTAEQPTSGQPTSGLAEAMEAAFADIVGTPPPLPGAKGEGTVIWYLKALQRLDKQSTDTVAYYDAMRDEISRWLDHKLEQLAKQMMWLNERMLPTVEAVTRAKIAHSGKKSFDFCYGVCSFRKQQDQWDWPDADDEALIKWCEDNSIPCEMKVTIDKKAIKDHYKATGEEPPGVTVTPGKDEFYVKPAPLAALPFEREQIKYIGPEPKE